MTRPDPVTEVGDRLQRSGILPVVTTHDPSHAVRASAAVSSLHEDAT